MPRALVILLPSTIPIPLTTNTSAPARGSQVSDRMIRISRSRHFDSIYGAGRVDALAAADMLSGGTDNDGIGSFRDNCPAVANANQANNDGDGLGDLCDPDDDNDTIPDSYEIAHNLDPFDPDDTDDDPDGDGVNNLAEFQQGTDARNSDTDGDGTDDGDEVDRGRDPLINEPAAIIPVIQMYLGGGP